ncbi:MAG: hypothetical protein K8R60_06845 [Burkholderiales bacterium]|nr:hypothetical protein [Burkholderiales bacterium]
MASLHPAPWAKRLPFAHLLAALALSLGASSPATAVDGCLVLLCFAAPSWKAIPQCVPPIQEVLRDLARGKPFPSCGMSGSGNTAENRRSSPDFCPPQYLVPVILESGSAYYCGYDGAISVTINGALWSRTWWSLSGDSVTEYTPEAKASLGTWDTRFDDDYAAWLAAQPPVSPEVCPPSC